MLADEAIYQRGHRPSNSVSLKSKASHLLSRACRTSLSPRLRTHYIFHAHRERSSSSPMWSS